MQAKPKHLGAEYAAQFADESVAGAYHNRIPYPSDVFAILAGLLGDRRHRIAKEAEDTKQRILVPSWNRNRPVICS